MKVSACAALAIALLSPAVAQTAPTLSKEAREFVAVDAPVVALAHVRVVDGTGAAAKEDQTVVISSGRIQAIGPAATTPAPAGAKTG